MAIGDNDDIIEEAVVAISPDTTGFRRNLKAQVAKAVAGLNFSVKVKLVADGAGFNKSAKAELAKQAALKAAPSYKVKLVADATGFNVSAKAQLASYAAGHRQLEQKVKLVADSSGLSNRVADKAARAAAGVFVRESGQAQQAATRIAERESDRRARTVERETRRINASLQKQFSPKIIDWGGQGVRPMNLLIGAAAALSPVLVAVASSAVQASTSIAALGAASIGTGLLVTGLTVAFKGLTDLLALRKTVQAQDAAETANSAATAAANTEAELRNRNSLIDTQKAELQAEKDLHDARREAARDLVNLKQKVRELQQQQRDDDLSLQEAQAKNAAVQRSFFATALEKARSAQEVRSARVQAQGTKLDRSQAQEDLADSVKKGVTRADKVTQAQESLRQARARAAEARLSSASAGITSAASKASSAQANLDAQLAKASPALRDMYGWVVKNQSKFEGWARQIQQAFLPGFNTLLDAIDSPPRTGTTSTLQLFVDDIAELGEIVSKYAGRFGDFTNSPFFREKFGTIQANNAASLENLGHAAETLQKPLLTIFAAASPLLTKFTGELEDFAGWLDEVIAKADRSGSLATWFADAGTEMDQWIGIAKDLLGILGDIFTASIPSGQSLVDRLHDFTTELRDWTSSTAGQQKMTAFFQFFKDLPYGKIFQAATSFTELFLAFRAARWAFQSPVWTAMGVLATAHPGGATALLSAMADTLNTTLGFMAAHPETTTALLAILAYAKLKKTFGLDLKIPAIDGLKTALASRFKILEGVFGGSASTGTMVVKAAVVNVYGATATPGSGGNGAKGGGGSTTVVPGVSGDGSKLATEAEKTAKTTLTSRIKGALKTGLKTVGGTLGIMAATMIGQSLLDSFLSGDENSFQGKLKSSLSAALTGAAWGSIFGPAGAAAGAVIGGVADQWAQRQREVSTKQGAENYAFNNLQQDVRRFDVNTYGKQPMGKVLDRQYVKEYIDARKANINSAVEQARATGGETAAQKVLNAERQRSINTLAAMLTQYGFTNTEAQQAASSVFGLVKPVQDVGAKAEKTAAQVAQLKGTLDAVVGEHHIQLSVDGYDDTKAKLTEMWNVQRVLYNPTYSNSAGGGGGADTTSSQSQYLDPITGQPVPISRLGKADGGIIPGHSPHPKADNIPAMLTANEYVQPVDAVKHYGVGFMEAVRTRQFPRFAKGGQVGRKWPFAVSVKDLPVPKPTTLPTPGGGQVSGSADVAAIAEATARAMGASDKQLVALMEAGLVESGMRNLTKAVDHDSLGFLQQRPSQGWGTARQILNVAYATRKFIEKAMRVDRAVFTSGQLAQQVQVSAFPDRYDKRYADAVAILNSAAPYMTGYNPSTMDGRPYAGKIPKGLGNVFNVSTSIMAAILAAHGAFPRTKVSSTYRPGARTVSGNSSWHSTNPARAADFSPPSMGLFDYFAGRYPNARELIYSPANQLQIKNGRRHMYSGDVRAQHFNHVHLALANGGLVQPRTYDTGGVLPPGYTLAFNGTGRNETIRTDKQERALGGPVRLHRADIALLATNIAAASQPNITMDGRAVAEVTNKYTYLPAGV